MNDLRTYLTDLGDRLLRIDTPLDPLTQVGVLSSESRVPYLLEDLKGFPEWKLTDILTSTREDQARALGCNPERLVAELADRIYQGGPGKVTIVDDGPCKEVTLVGDEADIRALPIPTHTVGDGSELGSRYLGSGLTVTKDPETGIQNEAIIRTHIRDAEPRRAGFWMKATHNWQHYLKYEAREEKMPMAFVVGAHPAYDILSNYSGPHYGYDEFALAAGVIGDELEMVKCETVDLEVPAHAELVIEGLVPPHTREPEGPFGEFTGFQGGKVGTAPVFEVTAITRRRDPIFRHMQATLFTDHQALNSLPMEAGLYQRVRDVQGHMNVHDVHVPTWVAQFTAIIQITPRWDGQAQAVGLAALSGVNIHVKTAIVVDDDVDIYSAEDVMWAMTQRVNPQKDVLIVPNERIHPLDQSVPPVDDEEVTVMRVGGKMVIDATKPATWRPKERAEFTRVTPMGTGDSALDEVLADVRARSAEADGSFLRA